MKKIFTISALIALFTLAFNAEVSAQNGGNTANTSHVNGGQHTGTVLAVEGGVATVMDNTTGDIVYIQVPNGLTVTVNDFVILVMIPDIQGGGYRIIAIKR